MTRTLIIFGFLTATLAGCMNDNLPNGTRAEPVGDAVAEPSDGLMNENETE